MQSECSRDLDNSLPLDLSVKKRKTVAQGASCSGDIDCSGISEQFLSLEQRQCEQLEAIQFLEPITHIYNPLRYASDPHCRYVYRYGNGPKQCLFLGMNPGPFGMAQTGVPFGQVNLVKTWLQIEGIVTKPANEHPQREIRGFECHRSEVSGQRFWSLFRDVCGTPDAFFRHCFVHNYCPLIFMSQSGKNVTPPSIAAAERKELEKVCDRFLCETVRLLQTETVVAIGRYTYERAKAALKQEHGARDVTVEFLMHPSPINPAANKGWNDIVRKKLEEVNVMRFLRQ